MGFLCCGRLCLLVVFRRSIAILDVSILIDQFGQLEKTRRWWRHLAAPFFFLLLRVFPNGGPRPLSALLYLGLEVLHAAQADGAAQKRSIFPHDGTLCCWNAWVMSLFASAGYFCYFATLLWGAGCYFERISCRLVNRKQSGNARDISRDGMGRDYALDLGLLHVHVSPCLLA